MWRGSVLERKVKSSELQLGDCRVVLWQEIATTFHQCRPLMIVWFWTLGRLLNSSERQCGRFGLSDAAADLCFFLWGWADVWTAEKHEYLIWFYTTASKIRGGRGLFMHSWVNTAGSVKSQAQTYRFLFQGAHIKILRSSAGRVGSQIRIAQLLGDGYRKVFVPSSVMEEAEHR